MQSQEPVTQPQEPVTQSQFGTLSRSSIDTHWSGSDSYVQRVPFLSRTTRFAILCSERNVFKARVEKELVGETVLNQLK
jgi:hypothetical protein